MAVVTDLAAVLRPFEKATKEVSGDRYVITSTVLPTVNCLQRAVANASFVNEDIVALSDARSPGPDCADYLVNTVVGSASVLSKLWYHRYRD